MTPKDWVKAKVVDIRKRGISLPRSVVVDTNVLFILHYDFSSLTAAGGKTPHRYQTRHYPDWWKRAAAGGVQFQTSASCLSEFVHVVERTELEVVWRMDPQRPKLDPANPDQDFSPRYVKTVRYQYQERLQAIREGVDTILQSLKKTVDVLPEVEKDDRPFLRAMREWVGSTADFGDAALVAAAKRVGPARIVSDDADFISFEGITLYTANQRAVNLADQAGTLA